MAATGKQETPVTHTRTTTANQKTPAQLRVDTAPLLHGVMRSRRRAPSPPRGGWQGVFRCHLSMGPSRPLWTAGGGGGGPRARSSCCGRRLVLGGLGGRNTLDVLGGVATGRAAGGRPGLWNAGGRLS